MSAKQLVGEFIDAAVRERSKALSLLAAHPELRSATWLGEPLLQFLAVEGYLDAVRFLVSEGFSVEGLTGAVPDVVMLGRVEALEVLIELGAKVDGVEDRVSPLEWAATTGRADLVQLLLGAGASIGPLGELEGLVEMLCPDEASRAHVLSLLERHRG